MSFDAYTTSGQGENKFQPLPILGNRDPVNGIDFSNPGGGPYQIDQKWFNLNNANYWRYIGAGTWVKDSSSTGVVIEFSGDVGANPVFPDGNGNFNLLSIAGGGLQTFATGNTMFFRMLSPYSLDTFEFTQQVGIQTPASADPLVPLKMQNTLTGNYGPVVTNLSTADNTVAAAVYFNGTDNIQMGMGSTGFVSNPILQGMAFFQSSAGMVWSCVDPSDVMNWYIGGSQAMNLSRTADGPTLQIFNGYLNLANQSKANSFQTLSLNVAPGGTSNVVIIGTGEHWQFFASTTPTTPDMALRCAATVLSYDNGSNVVDNFVSTDITFGVVGNQVNISNAGASSVNVMISGIRIL